MTASINERIRLILGRQGVPDKEAATWFEISPARLSQKFKAGIWDSVAEIQVIADKTGYSLDWIITGKGSEKPVSTEEQSELIEAMKRTLVSKENYIKELEKKLQASEGANKTSK